MKFSQPQSETYVPISGVSPSTALAKVTHLCVAAHQDDIEIMAYAGITTALDKAGKSFGGVVVTNGSGSPRTGKFAHLTDDQLQDIRRLEQREAARIGRYGVQIQLSHPSAAVKQPGQSDVVWDLVQIFSACQAEVVYLHNPTDKHDTHVAVFSRSLDALRLLPKGSRPQCVVGCEVWRDLDWLVDSDKVPLDVGAHPDLAFQLLKVFDSQVSGGKRYDLATIGRRAAHATFHTSNAVDQMAGVTWAMNLTPLLENPEMSAEEYTVAYIDRLRADVVKRIRAFN